MPKALLPKQLKQNCGVAKFFKTFTNTQTQPKDNVRGLCGCGKKLAPDRCDRIRHVMTKHCIPIIKLSFDDQEKIKQILTKGLYVCKHPGCNFTTMWPSSRARHIRSCSKTPTST